MIVFSPGPARKTVKRSAKLFFHSLTHPPVVATAEVKLPRGWVPCPLCTKHYVVKGRAHPVLCSMVRED